jgi:transcriptional regulator of acetoin/glycerol metabolism
VTLADLPPEIASSIIQPNQSPRPAPTHSAPVADLGAVERDAIRTAIASCHGNLTLAARALRISKSTLYLKVRKHGLDKTLLEARLLGR